MNSVRKLIRDIFGFSGNEINGFLILLPLMLVLLLSEPVYRTWVARYASRERSTDIDSLIVLWKADTASKHNTNVARSRKLFRFDPNTVSVSELYTLGFDGVTANRIAAYRSKGGSFRIKSDLMRIYGMDSALYNELFSYIALPVNREPEQRKPFNERAHIERIPVPDRTKLNEEQKFDINTADTIQLKSVYGIGTKLSARIVRFRDGLGGFVRPEQLLEVYGLDSATAQRLQKKCFIHPDFVPKKININTATQDKLSVHPYIDHRMARLVVSYRYQHGDFHEVSDIKKLLSLTPEEVDRLLPYLVAREE